MAPSIQGRPAKAWPAIMSLCLLLPACGGGGDPPATGGVTPREEPLPVTADATLRPEPAEVVESTRTGVLQVKAVGALDGGGHAVVWLSREAADPQAPWQLWVQRFDARGRKTGLAVRLDFAPPITGPQDLAATVLPEGRIGVTFVTDRVEDVTFAITEVHHWPFNLEGSIDGAVRVLDAERYARFSPRYARLAGPVTAAAGRDGSQFVAWRYEVIGAAPLAPSLRAQRLAADGEPLGWIQHLDGEGAFSRVRQAQITPLDEGGWVVALQRGPLAGIHYLTFTQLDVARPLALPQEAARTASSFLLDLRGRGSVLFSQAVDPASGETGPAQKMSQRLDPPRP